MEIASKMQKFKTSFGRQSLSVDDLIEAETSIIRFTLWERFHNEIVSLTSGKSKVKRESSIYKLDPVLEGGLLRGGGRLNRASMPEDVKHPLILSKDQYISHTPSYSSVGSWWQKPDSLPSQEKILDNKCQFCSEKGNCRILPLQAL